MKWERNADEMPVGKAKEFSEIVGRGVDKRSHKVEQGGEIQMIDRTNPELPAILTIKDAASYLRRCTKTIRNRIKSGELKSFREGQEHRIRREWLLEYEASLVSRSMRK